MSYLPLWKFFFSVPGKTVIFLGVKSVLPCSTLKIIKCHNKLACEYAMCIRHTHTCIELKNWDFATLFTLSSSYYADKIWKYEQLHVQLSCASLLNSQHQIFLNFSATILLHCLHQMVLKLFFSCSHNISPPDSEGADQPEEMKQVFDEINSQW